VESVNLSKIMGCEKKKLRTAGVGES